MTLATADAVQALGEASIRVRNDWHTIGEYRRAMAALTTLDHAKQHLQKEGQ